MLTIHRHTNIKSAQGEIVWMKPIAALRTILGSSGLGE
jgi:hypothetical protein